MIKKLPPRVYLPSIIKDLEKKMVFIGGPRPIGKTTLSLSLLKKPSDNHPAYLNWDNELSRKIIQKSEWPKDEPLMIFDEIHKKKGWQRFIKGIYDTWKNNQKFLITGSARLDTFRKGGDSMLGRYHYYRLHPYSLPELGFKSGNLETLFKYGGFPEPLLEQDETEHRRWQLQRTSKLIRIDLRDIENVSDLDKIELLAETLESRVGSILSYRSLAEDLEVSDKTIKRWIQILDSLYYCFIIPPYGGEKIKAVKKSQKLYLWDWSAISDPGARFENMVASHLLKFCHYHQDIYGHKMELRFLRDNTGKECDFVVLKNKKPEFAVECKLSDTNISPSLNYLKERTNIPRWYQVFFKGEKSKIITPDFSVISFEDFCKREQLI